MSSRQFLTDLFRHSVHAASAAQTLSGALPKGRAKGRTLVLGCGKAAAAMAEVAFATLEGEVAGCVVTRYGHGTSGETGGIEVVEASHPVPDLASVNAGRKIRELAESAGKDDRVIFLISGGGSALLCDPIDGLSLAQKAAITGHLVKSGASISEINLVRRHLSQVKGGRLAAAASGAGEMHSFLISDVTGDDPASIASGPSVATPFDPEAAIAALVKSGWEVSDGLRTAMCSAKQGQAPSHPVHIIANGQTALDAAAQSAAAQGWQVVRLGDGLEGDAAQTGRSHAQVALEHLDGKGRFLLLSGGELTVHVRSKRGRGGPNLEYLTGLMAALPPDTAIGALACDTDGIDGSQDNAGGWFDGVHRASRERCEAALAANSSYDLFEEINGLVITGPTRTNVNDIRMIAVEGVE